jgi:hypothetical protein
MVDDSAAMPEEEAFTLSEDQEERLRAAQPQAVTDLLDRDDRPANLVGVGSGMKWTNGEPTGKPALVGLVTHKVPDDELTDEDRLPTKVGRTAFDVLAVGELIAGGGIPAASGPQTLARRIRPAESGYSVGHTRITAGTLGTCVYDILPGGGVTPPRHGVGIPPRYYILSNNHVLANSNAATLGDWILQPGPFDGGTDPADRIARLSRFVPITFFPPTPLPQHRNLVDAAVAQGEFHDLDREIYWIGYVGAWRRRRAARVGQLVQKTGRTTNFTVGRITALNATVDVNYGGGRVARFKDQIVTTAMSAGGDSGSLVTTLDEIAVGLLFAGSSQATIINHIEHVRALLRVEVAERMA